MADYRLHAQIISRSDAKSAVKAAAYRAGEKILNERTGNLEDYTRKRGVLYTEILTPQNAAVWMRERASLWNGVEHREDKSTRPRDAQLARELQLSLPCELTIEQNIGLLRDFIKTKFVEHGVIADIAVHAPSRHGDDRNYHAHVLLTLREVGPEGFGKKARLWEQQKGEGKRKSWKQFEAERLTEWRREWAEYENRALARYGHPERVDHRSLKDQGIDREPTTHVGPDANEMERRGVKTDRGDQNRQIKNANDNIDLLKKELAESEKRLEGLKQRLAVERAERMERIQKTVRALKAAYGEAGQRHVPAPHRPPEPEPAPAKQPEIPAITWDRPRPSTAERIEQAQTIARAVDAAWEKAERQAPLPDRPPGAELPAPSPTPERASEPAPSAPAKPPQLPAPTPRGPLRRARAQALSFRSRPFGR
jgi:MobA/MobL family protein